MSPQMAENTALTEEVVSRIEEIERSSANGNHPKICEAHWPLVNGVCTLLRCEKARMQERASVAKEAKAVIWQTLGIAVPAAFAAAALAVELFKK